MRLFKFIVAIIVTVTLVIFAVANTHFTAVSFVAGSPVQVRVIVLLISTFFLGAISAVIFSTVRRIRSNRSAVRERPALEETDYVEDFD